MNNQATQEPSLRFARPSTRLVETAAGYLAEVELPGVDKSRLEITFDRGELTVIGKRRNAIPEGAESLYRESHGADFRRVFELDSTLDPAAITATLDQGLLTLQLPKAEASKARRIEVSGLN